MAALRDAGEVFRRVRIEFPLVLCSSNSRSLIFKEPPLIGARVKSLDSSKASFRET